MSNFMSLRAALVLLVWALAGGKAAASDPAEDWRGSGTYFSWRSALPDNGGKTVQVFYRCSGDARNPVILMLHGFPSSSFDFRSLSEELQPHYRVCTLDFPGYGVSDKPSAYRYSLHDDAQLVWDFVTTVVPLKEFILLSHDRGDSVALDFLQLYQAAANPPFRITHQFLTNANLYLPLANLTEFQTTMLSPLKSSLAVHVVSAQRLAAGMGKTMYSPALGPDDPEVKALAFNFAWQDGVRAIPATIQYLNERKKWEVGYLDSLSRSAVPVTLIWGVHDMVSPLRVANHVWETTLKRRPAPASYWIVPCANHYLAHDQPQELAALMRLALSEKTLPAPRNITNRACAPVLVDSH